MQNAYEFSTLWRVEGTCGEVADILGDPLALPQWWPAAYLDVQELSGATASQNGHGVGRRVRAHTRGLLPYTLLWEFEIIDSRYPYGFTIRASGDFDGKGTWSFAQDGRFVNITFYWRIRVEKPLVRNLSPVMKPLFEFNHRWAMAQGEKSLALELRRRRAVSDRERADVPMPPQPVSYAGVAVLAAVGAAGAGLAYLLVRSARRTSQ
jgi:hypothetical protein